MFHEITALLQEDKLCPGRRMMTRKRKKLTEERGGFRLLDRMKLTQTKVRKSLFFNTFNYTLIKHMSEVAVKYVIGNEVIINKLASFLAGEQCLITSY